MKSLIMLLMLISCGQKDKQKMVKIDSELQYLVNDFIAISNLTHKPVVIDDLVLKFVDKIDQTNVIGQCTTGKRLTPTIVILKSFFEYSNHIQRTQLLFHELGHCVLNLDHDSRIDGNRHYSLMNPYLLNQYEFQDNFDYFVKELFGTISLNQTPESTEFTIQSTMANGQEI